MSTGGAGTQPRRALETCGTLGLLEGAAHLWTMRDNNCVDAKGASAPQSSAGWMLARVALSECFPVGCHDWKFSRDGRGKPFIAAPQEYCGLGVSISHTDGLVACLISGHGTAAVDVEGVITWDDLPSVAPTILSGEEQRSIEALAGDAWTRRFYEYWTLKEAYAKARGVGLACEFALVSFDLGPGCDVSVRFADGACEIASEWLFRRLALGPRWAGAVAAMTGPSKTLALAHTELTPDMLAWEISRAS